MSKIIQHPTEKLSPHPLNREIYIEREDPEFLKSIKKTIVEPLIVDEKTGYVISGCRRLEASKRLGISNVPVIFRRFNSDLDLKWALVEANRYRIKTHSERMREADILEEIARAKAKGRQGRRTDLTSASIGTEVKRSDEEVADLVGYGSVRTYQRVRKVYEKAKEGNRLASRQMEMLDKNEVSPNMAYHMVRLEEIRDKTPRLIGRKLSPPKLGLRKGGNTKKFVCFSGGNDSLATLLECLDQWEDFEVLYVDPGIALPETNEYIEAICKELEVKLVTIRTEEDLWELVRKKGIFPSRRIRWCAEHLKFGPLRKFYKQFNSVVCALGVRRADSRIRGEIYRETISWDDYMKNWRYLPILNWTNEQVKKRIEESDLWENPCYEIYGHSGCYYCPFVTSSRAYLALKERHPDLFKRILDAEQSMRTGAPALWRSGGPLWVRDIERCVA